MVELTGRNHALKSNLKIKQQSKNAWSFWCEGCDEVHTITDAWQFNGDFENPTINPSVLVTRPANPNAGKGFEEYRTEKRCHSFIKNGKIEYLPDSKHDYFGTERELLPISKWRHS